MKMIDIVRDIARGAGDKILEIYHDPAMQQVEHKGDNSPLTMADQASHNYIVAELKKHFPDIPVLSEEGKEIPFHERKNWEKFWCVDPMDGTKEFIKRTGQFTVNIALIEGNRPVLGVIYVPALDITYGGELGVGGWKLTPSSNEQKNDSTIGQLDDSTQAINASTDKQINDPEHRAESEEQRIHSRTPDLKQLAIVASKDHAGPKVQQLVDQFPGCSLKSMGSSLKFCLVAEGAADIYLRDVPTYEWDTAAAQAIVEAAGGQVMTLDGEPLQYNKEDILNPGLLTIGAAESNEGQELKSQILNLL